MHLVISIIHHPYLFTYYKVAFQLSDSLFVYKIWLWKSNNLKKQNAFSILIMSTCGGTNKWSNELMIKKHKSYFLLCFVFFCSFIYFFLAFSSFYLSSFYILTFLLFGQSESSSPYKWLCHSVCLPVCLSVTVSFWRGFESSHWV